MTKLLWIGAGGFIGAVSRYVVSGMFYRFFGKAMFPYGTLAVNIIGCLLIGFLSGITEDRQILSPEMKLFIFIGILGGFTTFSTFGYEIFSFVRDGQILSSFTNLTLHMILGLGAVWLGYTVSKIM
ncbi:MAG: fluoride efflux transporter CrcB [Calditrichaceae bacterium]|nr:fluoride efflux transporter CrcB [Calditrichaceae bacterium]